MKKYFVLILCILLALAVCMTSCGVVKNSTTPWDSATYKEDSEFGLGKNRVFVEVIVEENSVTFTINTDKATLGDALIEHELVKGEKGAYGLYIKSVNGIEADYSKTKSFWAFCKDGESMTHGVDGEKIKDGAHYELVYTKE